MPNGDRNNYQETYKPNNDDRREGGQDEADRDSLNGFEKEIDGQIEQAPDKKDE